MISKQNMALEIVSHTCFSGLHVMLHRRESDVRKGKNSLSSVFSAAFRIL